MDMLSVQGSEHAWTTIIVSRGAIGSELTGEIARNVMIYGDKKFLKKVKDLGINVDLYGRYVDDVITALNTINRGWDYNPISNKMEYSKELDEKDTRSDDERTGLTRPSFYYLIHFYKR